MERMIRFAFYAALVFYVTYVEWDRRPLLVVIIWGVIV
jgi:hypothetical protein